MVDQTDDRGDPNPALQPPVSDPVMRPARWYYLDGEKRLGPMSLPAIRRAVLNGTVTEQTLVWADGMPDWLTATDVPALVPPDAIRQQLERSGWSHTRGLDDPPASQDQR
ncbi:MAG: DUF4339 domain-containing protein [Nitriliruptoraceae bacterium]